MGGRNAEMTFGDWQELHIQNLQTRLREQLSVVQMQRTTFNLAHLPSDAVVAKKYGGGCESRPQLVHLDHGEVVKNTSSEMLRADHE
jgi:hypothetical protein